MNHLGQASTGLTFLQDCIHVHDDDVFNLLVDLHFIERVIIGEDEDIQSLFQKTLPPNLKFIKHAYSYDFYKYNAYPSFSSFFVSKPKVLMKPLLEVDRSVTKKKHETELESAKQKQNDIRNEHKNTKQEYAVLQGELKSLEAEKYDLLAQENAWQTEAAKLRKRRENLQYRVKSPEQMETRLDQLKVKQVKIVEELEECQVKRNGLLERQEIEKGKLDASQARLDGIVKDLQEKVLTQKREVQLELAQVRRSESRSQRELEGSRVKYEDHCKRMSATKTKRDHDYAICSKKFSAQEPEEEISKEQCKDYVIGMC